MFNKQVFLPGIGIVEFCFHSIQTHCKTRYHVLASIEPNLFFHFEMHHKHDSWKILNAPQPPKWIIKLEVELSDIINEHATQTTLPKIYSSPTIQNVLV